MPKTKRTARKSTDGVRVPYGRGADASLRETREAIYGPQGPSRASPQDSDSESGTLFNRKSFA